MWFIRYNSLNFTSEHAVASNIQ